MPVQQNGLHTALHCCSYHLIQQMRHHRALTPLRIPAAAAPCFPGELQKHPTTIASGLDDAVKASLGHLCSAAHVPEGLYTCVVISDVDHDRDHAALG